MALRDHHRAWLSAHPERTAEWLQERLSDGFDVHHCDGDSGNNDPGNLALIEARDHLRVIHGHAPLAQKLVGRRPLDIARDVKIYEERRYTARAWREIGLRYGISVPSTMAAARRAAELRQLPWPIVSERSEEWLKVFPPLPFCVTVKRRIRCAAKDQSSPRLVFNN